jgi:DNA replication protein DnaC
MASTDKEHTQAAQRDEQDPAQLGDVAVWQRPVPQGQLIVRRSDMPELEAAIIAATKAMAACQKCKGAGWVRKADVPYNHPDFATIEKCTCRLELERAKRQREVMALSSLAQVRDKTFRNFNTRIPGVQQACKAALVYAQKPDGWLVFVGPIGCGKTHLAAAIANTCFDQLGMEVLFVTVPDLLDHLRATFEPASEPTYDEQFSRMRNAELLVLDDLGAQHSTDWVREKLFQLINYRYNLANTVDERTGRRRAATIITSNLFELNGVEERIRSRLHDTSVSHVIALAKDVQDYRPRNCKAP